MQLMCRLVFINTHSPYMEDMQHKIYTFNINTASVGPESRSFFIYDHHTLVFVFSLCLTCQCGIQKLGASLHKLHNVVMMVFKFLFFSLKSEYNCYPLRANLRQMMILNKHIARMHGE